MKWTDSLKLNFSRWREIIYLSEKKIIVRLTRNANKPADMGLEKERRAQVFLPFSLINKIAKSSPERVERKKGNWDKGEFAINTKGPEREGPLGLGWRACSKEGQMKTQDMSFKWNRPRWWFFHTPTRCRRWSTTSWEGRVSCFGPW